MTVQRTVISSEAARKMGEACEKLALEKGWHVSVWVIDEAGQSLYMYRMQGAPWLSVEPSRMKAQTALQSGRSSGSYEDVAKARGEIKGSTMAVLLHNFMAGGGLPVIIDGQVAGAIGVGGSPDDEGCARTGIEAVLKKWRSRFRFERTLRKRQAWLQHSHRSGHGEVSTDAACFNECPKPAQRMQAGQRARQSEIAMNGLRRAAVLAGFFTAVVAGSNADAESSVAALYQGKTITILVGSAPGGGYDGDARTVARHLGRHVPGTPSIVVQNMPGARGLAAANYLYNLAKRDGTVMGILEREHLIDAYLIPEGVRYDERNFGWIGSIGPEEGIAFAWHTAPQKTADDIRKSPFIVGGYSNSAILPLVYNNTMGTKFKLIKGYTGSGTVLLAVEKGEVQGIGNYSLSNLVAKHADWIKDRKINILFQTGAKRDAALPDVPLAYDFALNEEGRQILHLWLAPNAVARPLALPPEVPPDRLAAIREAFMALFQDPMFLSDARSSGMTIDPQDGEYIANLARELRALPPSTIEEAKAAAAE
jgi:uncharacterized protein GlcG (DUF336 family)/tripartite-type tricarboxylate transporter receptor subunit TctC